VLEARRTRAGTRLTLGGIPIGRLIERDASPRGTTHGFELTLPPGPSEAAGIGAARIVVDALAARAALPGYDRSS
jgi:hypothetical protein